MTFFSGIILLILLACIIAAFSKIKILRLEIAQLMLRVDKVAACQNGDIREEDKKEDPIPAIKTAPVIKSAPPKRTTHKAPTFFKKFLLKLTQGNLIARIGILLLIIGAAFLLKLAASAGYFPIPVKLSCVFILGLLLFGFSWLTNNKNRLFSIILSGGGFAICYLTTFVSFHFFNLLPASTALAIATLLMLTSFYFSWRLNAFTLIATGLIGGFLAPLLIHTPHQPVTAMLSYYLILNIGALILTYFRRHSHAISLAFVATYTCSGMWYSLHNQSPATNTLLIFLTLFFFIYLAATLLINLRTRALVLANPLVTLGLFYSLMTSSTHYHYVLIAGTLIYAALTAIYHLKKLNTTLKTLFLFITLLLFSITILLKFHQSIALYVWAIEGFILCYMGCKLKKLSALILGGVFQLGAAALLQPLISINYFGHASQVNHAFSALAILIAGLGSAFMFFRSKTYKPMQTFILAWALIWWVLTCILFTKAFIATDHLAIAITVYAMISAGVFWTLYDWGRWPVMQFTPALLTASMFMVFFIQIYQPLPLVAQTLIWFVGILMFIGMVYRHHRQGLALHPHLKTAMLVLTGIACAFTITQYTWHTPFIAPFHTWANESRFSAILAVFTLSAGLFSRRALWPFSNTLKNNALPCRIMAGIALLTMLTVNLIGRGVIDFHHYIIIFNSQDIASILVFTLMSSLITAAPPWRATTMTLTALFAFVALNSLIIRIFHFYLGVHYNHILHTESLQTTLSITWTIIAFICMQQSKQHAKRMFWWIGATLLALSVIKMIFIDMIYQETLMKVIAFLVVGLLFLLIGYFFPLPNHEHA
jgi:uncharacterized membrane protein